MSVSSLAYGPIRDHGVGDVAQALRRILNDAFDWSSTITVGARSQESRNALARARAEGRAEDGTGNTVGGVSLGTIAQADAFLQALPTEIPLPEVGVDPDGDILMEWYVSPRWVFTMTIDANGVVSYAGLYGNNKTHGREHFVDAVPAPVVDNLARLLSRWTNAKTG